MSVASGPWLPPPPRRRFTADGLEAYVSVPAGPVPEGGWPALVFLHGNGESAGRKGMPEAFLEPESAHGPLRRVSHELERRVRETFVIVAPQLPGRGGDVWHVHEAGVSVILDAVNDEVSVRSDRLTLCGFSYGANGVARLAAIREWHALWLVDPPMTPPATLPGVRWFRLALGEFTVGHEDGWLALSAPDRRATVDYGPDHVRSSWLDFAEWSHYRPLI